ncbi:META domain-containing protein [Salinimicrobium oceani]|uniref:META domain-containing protein n=1 Tax=Salinimicrobium oceani TaxID=2722702 RepID=A0ABX1CXC8_9FLAO|nr:META domain-containing protein [Salinimicrobium oceani]NJW52909.1 META domain-containing protein [Salinimicrobium oceani]
MTLDGNYRVLEVKGEKELPQDIIFNFNPVGNRVSGNAGCNQFSALYHLKGAQLEFSTPMNTRKFCEGRMEIERQILASLEMASRIEETESEVVLFAKNDEPLLILTKIE